MNRKSKWKWLADVYDFSFVETHWNDCIFINNNIWKTIKHLSKVELDFINWWWHFWWRRTLGRMITASQVSRRVAFGEKSENIVFVEYGTNIWNCCDLHHISELDRAFCYHWKLLFSLFDVSCSFHKDRSDIWWSGESLLLLHFVYLKADLNNWYHQDWEEVLDDLKNVDNILDRYLWTFLLGINLNKNELGIC